MTDVIIFAFNDLYNSDQEKKQPKNPYIQIQDWTGCIMNGSTVNTVCTEFRSASVSKYDKGSGGCGEI